MCFLMGTWFPHLIGNWSKVVLSPSQNFSHTSVTTPSPNVYSCGVRTFYQEPGTNCARVVVTGSRREKLMRCWWDLTRPERCIVTIASLADWKTIKKPLVPMVEQVPFHQWQWSPSKPLIFVDGTKYSAFMSSWSRYQTNQWQFLETLGPYL